MKKSDRRRFADKTFLVIWAAIVFQSCLSVQEITIQNTVELPAKYYTGEPTQVKPGYWENTTTATYDRKTVMYFFCQVNCDTKGRAPAQEDCLSAQAGISGSSGTWQMYNNAGVCNFLLGNYDNAYNFLVQAATLSGDDRPHHNLRVVAHVLQDTSAVVKP